MSIKIIKQIKASIEICKAIFKSDDFLKYFKNYLWLLASIFASYLGAKCLNNEIFKSVSEGLHQVSRYSDKASICVIASGIFAVIYLKKDLAQVILLLSIGLIAALNNPEEIYTIANFCQILALIYLIIKSSLDLSKSFISGIEKLGQFRSKKSNTHILSKTTNCIAIFLYSLFPVAIAVEVILRFFKNF